MHPSPWHDTSGGTWGLDIGTGANCVYPLLGASIYGWNFIGTGNYSFVNSYLTCNIALLVLLVLQGGKATHVIYVYVKLYIDF